MDWKQWNNSTNDSNHHQREHGRERIYKANWTTIDYAITYTGLEDGATFVGVVARTYTIENATFTLICPKRDGYTFTGWTGNNGTTAQTDVTIAKGSTGALSYTANWKAIEYKITYNIADGIVAEANPTSYTIETESFTLNNPTDANYEFIGWNGMGLSEKTMMLTVAQGSIGDKTYTAAWTLKTYRVTFHANTGTGDAMTAQSFTHGTAKALSTNTYKAPIGYTFAGWATSATGTVITGDYSATSDITLYAIWEDETALEVIDSPAYKVTQMVISPNPVSRSAGAVTIYFPQNIVGTGTCTIYDAQGNRIDHQDVNLTRGTAIRWDLCNEGGRRVASGGYLAILQVTDSMGMVHFAKSMIGVSQ